MVLFWANNNFTQLSFDIAQSNNVLARRLVELRAFFTNKEAKLCLKYGICAPDAKKTLKTMAAILGLLGVGYVVQEKIDDYISKPNLEWIVDEDDRENQEDLLNEFLREVYGIKQKE